MKVTEEFPFAYVVNDSFISSVCHFCLKFNDKLHCCTGCRLARYCNSECQKSAWQDHSSECKLLKAQLLHLIPDIVRLIARVIFKLKSIKSSMPNDRKFEELMSHKEEIAADQENSETLMKIYKLLNVYIRYKENLTLDQFYEIYGKVSVNSMYIAGLDQKRIATALYMNLSIIDHSCEPNCVVVFDGLKAILCSLKPSIKTDTPFKDLTICYIESHRFTKVRQHSLAKFYFVCKCPKCLDEELDLMKSSIKCSNLKCNGICLLLETSIKCRKCNKVDLNPTKINNVKESMQYIDEQIELMIRNPDLGFVDYKCKQLLTRCDRDGLHQWNLYRIILLCHLSAFSLKAMNFEQSILYLKPTLEPYRKYCYKNEPMFGFLLAQQGMCLFVTKKFKEALPILKEAATILSICYEECVVKPEIYVGTKELIKKCVDAGFK